MRRRISSGRCVRKQPRMSSRPIFLAINCAFKYRATTPVPCCRTSSGGSYTGFACARAARERPPPPPRALCCPLPFRPALQKMCLVV